MALYYDLPVYRDTYRLILKIFECTKDFSKQYKYTLGQDMKRDALQLVRSIYRANKNTNKKDFSNDSEFKRAFYNLTPGRQRSYVIYFSQPKNSQTKINRIKQCRQNILNGIGLNDKYSC